MLQKLRNKEDTVIDQINKVLEAKIPTPEVVNHQDLVEEE